MFAYWDANPRLILIWLLGTQTSEYVDAIRPWHAGHAIFVFRVLAPSIFRSVPFGPERQQSTLVSLISHLIPSGSRSLVINKVMPGLVTY